MCQRKPPSHSIFSKNLVMRFYISIIMNQLFEIFWNSGLMYLSFFSPTMLLFDSISACNKTFVIGQRAKKVKWICPSAIMSHYPWKFKDKFCNGLHFIDFSIGSISAWTF